MLVAPYIFVYTDGTGSPPGGFTVNDKEQLCPPKLIAKLAVPAEAGVPLILYDKLPVELVSMPACNVAVKPVTPVDAMDEPAVYDILFPPA